jgi:thiosulfate/3-mercaptopyruvate sulfurtransferase
MKRKRPVRHPDTMMALMQGETMTLNRQARRSGHSGTWRASLGLALAAAAIMVISTACSESADGSASSAEPWGANIVGPADFDKEIAGAKGNDKPVIVCTAPAFMYRVGHIPGAVLHGPTNEPEGLNDLTNWAQGLPRSTSLVIYCGCCPLSHCPNLRPAYAALKNMGFTRLRVLILPNNFGTDWVDRGYAVER